MKSTTLTLSVMLLVLIITPLSNHLFIDSSGIRSLALKVERAKLGNMIRPEYYPTIDAVSGPQKTLVILVDFSDVKHTLDKSSIDTVIFGEMAKYYAEVSYGQIQIVGQSVGWYPLSHTMAYYGADIDPSRPGSDARKIQLIQDALNTVPEGIDSSDYLRIVIVHAGIGQEDSVKQPDLIWSEAIWSGLSIQARSGAIIESAAIVPEMELNRHSTLGVSAHEFGHLLSLPDLYDVSSNSTIPDRFVGRWSLMGTGPWLGNPKGSSPAELEAWSRMKLGWLAPDGVRLTPGNISFQLETLQPLEITSGVRAIKIPTMSVVYYLVEFRKRMSYDSYLPSEGVLVTRIDETRGTGNGIVQVIDSNSSTRTLNDATFGSGTEFKDLELHIFIDIVSRTPSAFSVLIGNQEPSSFPLIMTEISSPAKVNATYLQPISISAKLTDQYTRSLSGLPVKLQYYGNGQWNDLGIGVTGGQGLVDFELTPPLKPGRYFLRFLFAGGMFGSRYLVGSDQQLTLNLRKISTNLHVEGQQIIQAMQTSPLMITVTDEFGRPVENVRVLVWVDNQLVQNRLATNGTFALTLTLGLDRIGTHNLKIEVEEDAIHSGATLTRPLIVTAPAWLYAPIAVAVLFAVTLAYMRVRRRLVQRLFRTSTALVPQHLRLIPAFVLSTLLFAANASMKSLSKYSSFDLAPALLSSDSCFRSSVLLILPLAVFGNSATN